MLFRKSRSEMTDEQKRARIDAMYQGTKAKAFPNVPEISAEEIRQRQDDGEKFVFVDVRAPQEQEVSMIRGAVTLQEFEANPDRCEDATVVCYCTIGGRSGKRTAQLRAQGHDVHNLPGSVLSWSHAGGTFVDADGEESKRVHVFNARFNLVADGYEGVW